MGLDYLMLSMCETHYTVSASGISLSSESPVVMDSWFSHLAVEVPAEGASNEWMEPVSDEDYNRLKGRFGK